MALDLLAKALHHLLQLIDHGVDGWVCGFGKVCVVVRIRLHGS
jgi:hypothetical protein